MWFGLVEDSETFGERKSIEIKVRRDNNDNDNTFQGFHQLYFVLSMFLISHSRPRNQIITPLNHGRLTECSLGLDFSSHRGDYTTFGHISDTVSIILGLLLGREPPLTPQ